MIKQWMSKVPERCDLCDGSIKDSFVDGRMKRSSTWAIFCLSCHKEDGAGLGTGLGQQYDRRDDGVWEKVGG